MKTQIQKFTFSACILTAFLIVANAPAADGDWSSTASGVWTNNANWSGGTVADGSGFTANFNTVDPTGDLTVIIDTPQIIGNLTFDDTDTNSAAGWILNNNSDPLNILTLAATTPTITVNALATGKRVSISNVIGGAAGLIKTGSGTLALSGTNTYTGITELKKGVVRLDDAQGLPGGIGVAGGTSNLKFNSANVYTDPTVIALTTASGDFTRNIGTGANQVQWPGAGGFAAYGGDRNINFNGAGASFSWSFTLRFGGGLVLGADDSDSTVTVVNGINVNNGYRTMGIRNGSAPVDAILAGPLRTANVGDGGYLVFTGPGTVAITGAAFNAFPIKVDAGTTVTIGNGAAMGSLVGGVVEHYGTLVFNRSDALTFANPINNSGTVKQIGAGTTTLTATSVYSGRTLIEAGALALSGTASIANSSVISIASAATFDVSALSSPFTLGSSQTLSNSAAATGIVSGSNNTASGIIAVSYAAGTPSLLITNGGMMLDAATTLNINNSGPALAGGSYKIIAKAAGASPGLVAGTVPGTLNVTGGGVSGTPSLQIIGDELFLVVTVATPPTLNLATSGSELTFTWSEAGYKLQSQTNALSVGLSTNWFDYPDGSTSPVVVTNDPANPSEFFRLISQ